MKAKNEKEFKAVASKARRRLRQLSQLLVKRAGAVGEAARRLRFQQSVKNGFLNVIQRFNLSRKTKDEDAASHRNRTKETEKFEELDLGRKSMQSGEKPHRTGAHARTEKPEKLSDRKKTDRAEPALAETNGKRAPVGSSTHRSRTKGTVTKRSQAAKRTRTRGHAA